MLQTNNTHNHDTILDLVSKELQYLKQAIHGTYVASPVVVVHEGIHIIIVTH